LKQDTFTSESSVEEPVAKREELEKIFYQEKKKLNVVSSKGNYLE
jgi:hypothetical protein